MKLNAKAFALSLGLVWGLGVIVVVAMGSLVPAWQEGMSSMVSFMGKLYLGYDMTLVGALIGGVWGFVDAFIGGYIVAWLYNKFA